MARAGREFELKYKWLYELDSEKYQVTSPAYLYDRAADELREVDVLIEYADKAGTPRKLGIECRDRKATQDVIWIEQLKQKREDLGLDFLIATTTTHFSEGAIKKARYHGVVLEQAESFERLSVETEAESFFFDIFFLKFELHEFTFHFRNNISKPFKQLVHGLSIGEQLALIKWINTEFYYSIDPGVVMKELQIDESAFFSKEDNRMDLRGGFCPNKETCPTCMSEVIFVNWQIMVMPHKISLPLDKSVSVFDGESHSNKQYRAVFGNEEDSFKLGYLNDRLFADLKLKERKYMRIVSGNLNLNTIVPGTVEWDTETVRKAMLNEKWLGEFDLSHLT